jgi:Skp family chaperone for outer membrane proteins
MARNAAQQKNEANGAAKAPAPESIDQVRDLLFGGQMRMVDARLQSLDERMARETTAMRTEFERQIAELDSSVRKELGRHAERLAAERTKRADDLKALSAELKESLKSLEKRHVGLEEAAGLADAELRDHLMKQGAAFTTELNRTSARLTSELDRIATTLKDDKLDSALLISGLTELAGKIGAAPKITGKKPQR